MHQSSQPTLFTIHIRVKNRSVTSTVHRAVARMTMTKRSVESFLSPESGGVLGCAIIFEISQSRVESQLRTGGAEYNNEYR